MGKKHTGRAVRGSQFHLQNLITNDKKTLNRKIKNNCPSLKAWISSPPIWVSPLAEDDYEEYQDRKFLDKIRCLEVYPQLKEFWPRRGPVWDGLAILSGINQAKGVILLEAKSHLEEVMNPNYSCKASPKSREHISLSLDRVKIALGVDKRANWLGEVYQHANRIAYLYFLRCIVKIPTWLISLYFLGDTEQGGPNYASEYKEILDGVKNKLGLPNKHIIEQYLINVFIEVPQN